MTRQLLRLRYGVLVLAAAAASPLAAQDGAVTRTIAAGGAVTDSLPVGTTHAFTLDLAADQFVYGEVEERSVDVSVTVRDPEGEVVRRFDGRRRGRQPFHFESEVAGMYMIDLEPAEDSTGSYELRLDRVEPIAVDPAARADQIMLPFSGDVPGGLVAVVRDGRLVFARGYGMADLSHDIPFSTETRTNIGSTSKQFTAFAINLLAQRGELSLDDDIRTHIPEVPDLGATVTIRHLLTHTSGYREFLNTLALAGRQLGEGDHIDRSEIIGIVQRQPELQNAPGAEWNYNNTAFALLAMVVERVTDTPFPDWMRENVFAPLGMHDTVVRAAPSQIVEDRAMGYIPLPEGGYREASDLGGAMGAGGMYTTVGDLARWIANLESGELGGRAMIEAMTTPFVLTTGDTTNYGFGLMIDEVRGLRRIRHGGADVAHRSMLAYYPAARTGVVVLSNNAGFPGSVHPEVAEAFLGEALAPEDQPAAVETGPFDPASYDPASFDELAGRYSLDPMPAFVMTFWRDADTLWAQATGQPRIPLTPTSDTTFTLVGVPAAVTFHRDADGEVTHLTLHQNGDHRATRLEGSAWDPSPEELAAYTGRYFSDELETFYTVDLEEEHLVIRHRRLAEPIELDPAQEADSFTGGFPVAQVEFERDSEGRVKALVVGNGRTRAVRFERVD